MCVTNQRNLIFKRKIRNPRTFIPRKFLRMFLLRAQYRIVSVHSHALSFFAPNSESPQCFIYGIYMGVACTKTTINRQFVSCGGLYI